MPAQDSGVVPFDGGDPGATCAAPGDPGALLATAQQAIDAAHARRSAIWSALFGLKSDGTLAPGGLDAIDWDPGHDSIAFQLLDVERDVPILVANDAGAPPSKGAILGVAGEHDGFRYALLGNDPLSDLALKPPAAGSGGARMDELDLRLVKWLLGKEPGDGAGTKIVLAHLADDYWFPHDAGTAKFFSTKLPAATVNAEDTCESGALAGCLTGASLLVISGEDGTKDSDHKVPADVPAVLAALDAAEAAHVPVLFVGYGSDLTPLGARIVARLRVAGSTNYWAKERLAAWSPTSLAALDDALAAYGRTVDTLRTDALANADYASCLGKKTLDDCTDAAFVRKLGGGTSALRGALAAIDGQGTDLRHAGGYDLLRALVDLGDAYRAGDALAYPIDPKGDPRVFARAVFADASVSYAQACNHRQRDLGTFVCDRAALLAHACPSYDPGAAARVEGTIDEPFPSSEQWTSTGYYALPGVAFTVRRDDAVDAEVAI